MAALVSKQALTAAIGDLLTKAATMDEAGLTTLAADLAGVAGVLAGQPHLRRMFTETTVPAAAKADLAGKLFGGKIADGSLKLVSATVGRRWSTGSDLVDALRRLARTALFLQAERSGELDDVEDELFRFGRILDANPDLAVILDDPATSAQGRADLVGRLLAGKAHRLTVKLLTDLARNPSGRTFAHGVGELVEQAAKRQDKLVAIVTSAVPLSTAETDRLRSALDAIYQRPVAVHVIVDAAVGGGLRIRVGDEVIDGTVSGRLADIRQRLTR